jgi:competence protein ComEA
MMRRSQKRLVVLSVIGLFMVIVTTGTGILIGMKVSEKQHSPLIEPTPQPTQIVVAILGAVTHPGVYTLSEGTRVITLMQKAGGSTPGADIKRVNPAAPLFDGAVVYVPLVDEPLPGDPNLAIKVNINLASAEALHLQLGISLKTAGAIVMYRQEYGPFITLEELLKVPISATIYKKIKDRVTI